MKDSFEFWKAIDCIKPEKRRKDDPWEFIREKDEKKSEWMDCDWTKKR